MTCLLVSAAGTFQYDLIFQTDTSQSWLGILKNPRIVRLDSAAAVTQKALSKAENHRNNIQTMVNAHRQLISWVRFVPPEIWSQIFLFCLPSEDEEPFLNWDPSKPPCLFGRVCSTWRTIALATPQLWASLGVHVQDSDRPWKDQLKACVNRTGTELALSIGIEYYLGQTSPSHASNTDSEDITVLLTYLQISSYRLKRLKLFLPIQQMNQALDMHMPHLLSLVVGGTSSTTHIRVALPSHNAPHLAEVAFQGKYQDPRHWDIPWYQLREIACHFYLSGLDIIAMLQTMPLVRRAKFRVGTMMADPPRILTLEHLRVLEILVAGRDDCSKFFDFLTLPVLSSVAIFSTSKSRFLMYRSLIILARRSKCPLKTLTLKEYDSPHFMEVLECVESIGTLEEVHVLQDGQDVMTESMRNVIKARFGTLH